MVNISLNNTWPLSTNAAPGIERRTDVGDKCQLHLITPALCYIVHFVHSVQPHMASDYTHPMALPSPHFHAIIRATLCIQLDCASQIDANDASAIITINISLTII